MDRESFGARLRALRAETGVSQATAAQAARIHPRTWHQYETGIVEPRALRIPAIASAINAEVGKLYTPAPERFVGEVLLSPASLESLRSGDLTAEDLAQRLASALVPRLHAMARPPLNDGPPRSRNSKRKRSRAEVYESLAQAARRRADRAAQADLRDAGGGGAAREEQ